MTTKFELYNQRRIRYQKGYLSGLVVFFVVWIIRSTLKIMDAEAGFLESILLIILIACVAVQAFYALKENLIKIEMNKDPSMQEAMQDELMQLNELKAWRTAFFSLVGFIFIVAILSLFIQFNDMMLIFITALLIGFGSYNSTVFWLNR